MMGKLHFETVSDESSLEGSPQVSATTLNSTEHTSENAERSLTKSDTTVVTCTNTSSTRDNAIATKQWTSKQDQQIAVLRDLYCAENAPQQLLSRTWVHSNVHPQPNLSSGRLIQECKERDAADDPPPLDHIPQKTGVRLTDPSQIPVGDTRDEILQCFQKDPFRSVLGKDWDAQDGRESVCTFFDRFVRDDLRARDVRLTGSVAGIATDDSRYYTRYNPRTNMVEFLRGKVWFENAKDFGQFTHGHRYEDMARDEFVTWYREQYGFPTAQVYEYPMLSSRQCPWIGISVDGILFDDPNNSRTQALVEIKCPFFMMHTENHPYAPGIVKPEYMSQMQLYAGYLNRYFPETYCIDRIFFVVWQPYRTYITRVALDDAFYESLTSRMEQTYFRYFLPSLIAREKKKLPYRRLPLFVERLDTRNLESIIGKEATARYNQVTKQQSAIAEECVTGSSSRTKTSRSPTIESLEPPAKRRACTTTPVTYPDIGVSYRNVFWMEERRTRTVPMEPETAQDNDVDDDLENDDDNHSNSNSNSNSNSDLDDLSEASDDVMGRTWRTGMTTTTTKTTTTTDGPGSQEEPDRHDQDGTHQLPEPFLVGEGAFVEATKHWYKRKYVRIVYKEHHSTTLRRLMYLIKVAYFDGYDRIIVDLCTHGPPPDEFLHQFLTQLPKGDWSRWNQEIIYVFPVSLLQQTQWMSIADEFQSFDFRFYAGYT